MKLYRYLLALAAPVALLSSCEMNEAPEGGIVTEEQKSEVIGNRPELLSTALNAMKDCIVQFGTISTDAYTYHYDYGVPSTSLMFDSAGQDMIAGSIGYNWFNTSLTFDDRVPQSSQNKMIWQLYYTHIKSANDVIVTVTDSFGEDEIVDDVANYLGQAYATRAYDYTQLIQLYQKTYMGNQDKLGIPIVLETTTVEEAANNPRATVEVVYAQIVSDLDLAVKYLSENPITRADKAQITAEVAYGLRARVNMLMNKWDAAIADADAALAGGAAPYTLAEVSVPAFNDAAAASWIWGAVITDQNDVVQTGIINWPSHLCSLTGNGYTTGVGISDVYKCINSTLWATIPDTDIRKDWWVDADLNSALMDNFGLTGWAAELLYAPYTNVKFGPEANEPLNPTNAQDWPLMRAEEMILIKAEALAQKGDGAGAAAAMAVLMAERDPEWNAATVSVDDVWNQRRIELWGEGFSLFDILRLNKPIIRKGANFEATVTYDIEAGADILIYNIPEVETESNPAITDINPIATPPTPAA